jgi:hypothetical protein
VLEIKKNRYGIGKDELLVSADKYSLKTIFSWLNLPIFPDFWFILAIIQAFGTLS